MKKKKPVEAVHTPATAPQDPEEPTPKEIRAGNDGLSWEDIAGDYSGSILALSPAAFKKAIQILADRETDETKKAYWRSFLR